MELFGPGANDSVSGLRPDGEANSLGSHGSMLREALGFLNVAEECSSGKAYHFLADEIGMFWIVSRTRSTMAGRDILNEG